MPYYDMMAEVEVDEGSLRVWHIPQIPMNEPFYVPVSSPEEAIKVLEILGRYDDFQYRKNIKPDYSNVSGLEVFENGEWVEWYDDNEMDIDEYQFYESPDGDWICGNCEHENSPIWLICQDCGQHR